MSTKLKLRVTERIETEHGVSVHLNAIYAPEPEGDSDNHLFWDATPNAKLSFSVTNKDLVNRFTPGQDVYITLDHAE